MNRQVHDALRHAVQLSLTLSACVYQSVCLSMISLPQTMSFFIFYQMLLKPVPRGNLLRPCVPLCLCHCLLLRMTMDPTPGWLPTHLVLSRPFSNLADIPWVPGSRHSRGHRDLSLLVFLSRLSSLPSYWPRYHLTPSSALDLPAAITHKVFPNIHVTHPMIFHLFD